MGVTMIPIVVVALGTVPQDLGSGLDERPKYWDESWRLEQSCYHTDSSKKKTLANVGVKNSWAVKL